MTCDYWAFGAGAGGSGYAPCGTCERCLPSDAIASSRSVQHQIDKAGLMPPGCKLIDIVISVDGAIVLKYERFLGPDEVEQLGIALCEAMKDRLR